MQIHNDRSPGKSKDIDALLTCRMSMLGLDPFAVETDNKDTSEEIMRRCVSCGYRDACAVDLERDPNDPIWETYCPNASTFLGLVESSWLLKC
jgi:hypothetical protein